MEKLETVKNLVRANNYQNHDLTYRQCMDMGVTVNRVGLELFAQKLRQIDHADMMEAQNKYADDQYKSNESMLSFEKSSAEYRTGNVYFSDAQHIRQAKITSIKAADTNRKRGSYNPIERKKEITFELGTIRVREYQLLQELNMLISEEHQTEPNTAMI